MALLFDEDYNILYDSGLNFTEDAKNRFLIITNYPLPEGVYTSNDTPISEIEVLVIIPSNYNTSGGDMFWTYPDLLRSDGVAIPAYGASPKTHNNKVYKRWSRHWKPETWEAKVDNIQKILSRIEWALRNPNANR